MQKMWTANERAQQKPVSATDIIIITWGQIQGISLKKIIDNLKLIFEIFEISIQ